MPRVVPDQRTKFETDELFKKLSQEMDVGIVCRILNYVKKTVCACSLFCLKWTHKFCR